MTPSPFYPKEMYKDGLYRVVHGPEEEANFIKVGWSTDFEDGKDRSDYAVHHANPHEPVKRGPGRPPKA